MKRIALYVPEQLNDGSLVPAHLFESYEDELFDIAARAKLESGYGEEGFTVSHAVGSWRSPSGTRYREPVVRYELDVADAEPAIDDVSRLAERVRAELDQQIVYVTVFSIEALTVTEPVIA